VVALVFFFTPPTGAAMAALAFWAAVRRELRCWRPPRRPEVSPPSFMIWSRDWSSFPDMLMDLQMMLLIGCVCGIDTAVGVSVMS